MRSIPHEKVAEFLRTATQGAIKGPGDTWFCAFRFRGVIPKPADHPQTILCGYHGGETAAGLRVMLDEASLRLRVDLHTQSGYSADRWLGPRFTPGAPFQFELALHSGMGPGGILFRNTPESGWSSLETESSKGCEDIVWPPTWVVGRAHYHAEHDPWRGEAVHLERTSVLIQSRASLFS
jgi:hypothetical protein